MAGSRQRRPDPWWQQLKLKLKETAGGGSPPTTAGIGQKRPESTKSWSGQQQPAANRGGPDSISSKNHEEGKAVYQELQEKMGGSWNDHQPEARSCSVRCGS
jgi:hypothetical protein